MFKLQFIFLVLFPFIFSIFVNCVGEPRGVGIHGAIWGAILSGIGKKQQITSQCSKNPEDLCCRNGMGKCAALILGCGTIFGIFLLAFGLFWFKMKRYCLHRK